MTWREICYFFTGERKQYKHYVVLNVQICLVQMLPVSLGCQQQFMHTEKAENTV